MHVRIKPTALLISISAQLNSGECTMLAASEENLKLRKIIPAFPYNSLNSRYMICLQAAEIRTDSLTACLATTQ